jgi:hypothetical protein
VAPGDLTTMWAQGGRKQGADLDHTALRWTLLALTDPNDLELFIKVLHSLLQSDSGTGFTRDGGCVAQGSFFGPHMLWTNIVQLLHSAIPSEAHLPTVDGSRRAPRPVSASSRSLPARVTDPLRVHITSGEPGQSRTQTPSCAMRSPSATIHS